MVLIVQNVGGNHMKRPDWNEINERLNVVETQLDENVVGWMDDKNFSLIMQDLLISKGGYIIDIGDWETVNYACCYGLLRKIKKHPILWKIFMLA